MKKLFILATIVLYTSLIFANTPLKNKKIFFKDTNNLHSQISFVLHTKLVPGILWGIEIKNRMEMEAAITTEGYFLTTGYKIFRLHDIQADTNLSFIIFLGIDKYTEKRKEKTIKIKIEKTNFLYGIGIKPKFMVYNHFGVFINGKIALASVSSLSTSLKRVEDSSHYVSIKQIEKETNNKEKSLSLFYSLSIGLFF